MVKEVKYSVDKRNWKNTVGPGLEINNEDNKRFKVQRHFKRIGNQEYKRIGSQDIF